MADVPSGTVTRAKPRGRPDPRPARLMLSAGAVAAMTLIAAGLVRVPMAAEPPPALAPVARGGSDLVPGGRHVRYVRLKPGQRVPPGAKVIQEAAPRPRVIVRLVGPPRSAPAPRAATPVHRVVTRTRQSGA